MRALDARDWFVRAVLTLGFGLLVVIAVGTPNDSSRILMDLAMRCLKFGAARGLMDIGPLLL